MEESRLAQRNRELTELEEIDTAKGREVAELAEQVKLIEEIQER